MQITIDLRASFDPGLEQGVNQSRPCLYDVLGPRNTLPQ
jgi:hypothetical protein